jgi:adenylate cyclase
LSAERVERRLAAILAADVAGYSRLMGLDEAGTLARLNALRRELIDPRVVEHLETSLREGLRKAGVAEA